MNKQLGQSRETVIHGGDLADAVALTRSGSEAASGWLDLSTGIAPSCYPLPEIDETAWTRLPGRGAMSELNRAAASYYGAPSPDNVSAGPGSQALIECLPVLFPESLVAIISPTYSGHAGAWERAGHSVRGVSSLGETEAGEIAVLVNPNNPDGRLYSRDELAFDAVRRIRASGWLVVDEAFGDVAPQTGIASLVSRFNVVALRSFGKFFGLAGLRLGFAIAPREMTVRLREALGAWPVSGPAITVGTQALKDTDWQAAQRARLDEFSERLEGVLTASGLPVIGGTALFRLCETEHAQALFAHLLDHRIYVRAFEEHATWLRIGVPGSDEDFARLDTALGSFSP